MVFCQECGGSVPEGCKFCPLCGTRLIIATIGGGEPVPLSLPLVPPAPPSTIPASLIPTSQSFVVHPTPPQSHSSIQVSSWKDLFISVGIPPFKATEYEQLFIKNGIDDLKILNDLDLQLLEQMGIQLLGDRLKILKLQKKEKPNKAPPPPPPGGPRSPAVNRAPTPTQFHSASNPSSPSLASHYPTLPHNFSNNQVKISPKVSNLTMHNPRGTFVQNDVAPPVPPFVKQNSLPNGFNLRTSKETSSPHTTENPSPDASFLRKIVKVPSFGSNVPTELPTSSSMSSIPPPQPQPSFEDSLMKIPIPLMSEHQKTEIIREAEKKLAPTEGSWGRLIPLTNEHNLDICDLKGDTIVGRNSACDIPINDPLISGKHFRLFSRPSKSDGLSEPCIEDLSTNGTYLQGIKIGTNRIVPLNDKDEIRVDYKLNPEKTEATDQLKFIFHINNPTRKWRQRYESLTSKLDEATKQRSSTLRNALSKPKLEREDTIRVPLGVLHARALTDEEIEKYKRDQIERYERETKENEELLKQVKEGKIVIPNTQDKKPLVDDRASFIHTMNQGIQDANEDQKRIQNERLKTQIMYLQRSVDASVAENDSLRDQMAQVKQLMDRFQEEKRAIERLLLN